MQASKTVAINVEITVEGDDTWITVTDPDLERLGYNSSYRFHLSTKQAKDLAHLLFP